MTTNLQQLYKDIIDSTIEEKLKYAFLAMIETAVVENEEIVKNKIKRMLDEYIAKKDTEANLLEKIESLEQTSAPTQQVQATIVNNPVVTPVQQTPTTPVSDAQAIADIQNQLQSMPSNTTSLPS